MTEPAQTLKLNPWFARAEDLARWAMLRLVNRTDRCGRYGDDPETGKAAPKADPAVEADCKLGHLSHQRLARHFRATSRGAVVGAYAYGADKVGKWLNVDIDNHDDKGDPLANELYAVHVARKAAALGLCVLLYESNGKGGFHLWVLFADPVPARALRSVGEWLVSDHAEWKFERPPEVFPKGECDKPWGNWVRLPGRHHTRDVWPRVWTGEEWATGEAAVAFVLGLTGCDPALVPSEALVYGLEVQTGGGAPKPDRPPGLVYAWEDFNAKAAAHEVGALLERHGWTRAASRGDGAVEYIRPGKGPRGAQGGNLLPAKGTVIFYCFTDGAPPLKPMHGYTPAALLALLEHGGDFQASNKALYEKGFGTRAKKEPKPKAGQSGYAPAQEDAPDDRDSELVFAPVAGIVPEAVHYLVPGYVPRGMLGMIAGEGGHGKSMTTLELAAALSVGRCAFGLSYPDPPKGKTLLISCEDDWARTIVPRLVALGADRNNVLRVEGVRMKAGGKVLDFHMGHYAQLERALLANPDIKLIVIDPAGAFIGRAGVNENQDAELRAVLGPLSEAANRSGATALLIKHLNKSAGVSAVQRVGGSAGYVNAVRFAYMVAPDPDDGDKKLMLPIKANVLKSKTAGLAYRMEDVPLAEGMAVLMSEWPDMKPVDATELAKQLFRQAWEGGVEATADQIAGLRRNRQPTGKTESVQDCAQFIREFLGAYAWPDEELEAASIAKGFSKWTYRQTKTAMKTDMAGEKPKDLPYDSPFRFSTSCKGGDGKWWCWIGSGFNRPSARPQGSAMDAINASSETEGIL